MRIGGDAQPGLLRRVEAAPDLAVGDEEELVGSEPRHRAAVVAVALLIGLEGQPRFLETAVVGAILLYEADLAAGALVVIEVGKNRVRVLPI